MSTTGRYAGGMTTPVDEQCQWPVAADCLPEITDENAAAIREAVDTATLVLWSITGRRFGICPQVLELPDAAGEVCRPGTGPRSRSVQLTGVVQAVTAITDGQGNPVEGAVVNRRTITNLPSTALRIEYLEGEAIPPGAAQAVGTLAKERYLQCIGDDRRCRLPSNATNVTRQGVSVQLATPDDWIRAGKTGLDDVDSWVAALNPRGDAEPSEVLV